MNKKQIEHFIKMSQISIKVLESYIEKAEAELEECKKAGDYDSLKYRNAENFRKINAARLSGIVDTLNLFHESIETVK